MSQGDERLYKLLPAIHRRRDADQGEPLRALLGVIERELHLVEADIAALYDNWFIETCDEWVVPYLAELLGVAPRGQRQAGFSQRAHVARQLGYQRRKGRADTLRHVAQDVSGWPVRVVEYGPLLGRTQQLQQLRPGHGRLADVRAMAQTDPRLAHRPDVRRIAAGRGRHNLGNVGVFVWRLRSFPLRSDARLISSGRQRLFCAHPLGIDAPLFARADAERLPVPLDPTTLAADLANAAPDGTSALYGPGRSLAVLLDGTLVPAANVALADLSDPEASAARGWRPPESAQVVIDVRAGRLLLLGRREPQRVQIESCYGFSAPLGGGPYDRRGQLADGPGVRVARGGADDSHAELAAALGDPRLAGLVEIADSGSYVLPPLALPDGARLMVQAASGERPHLRADDGLRLSVAAGASLTLSGLLLEGPLAVSGSGTLRMIDCSLPGGIGAAPGTDPGSLALQISLERCISGPLLLPDSDGSLDLRDSIVDRQPTPGAPVGADAPAIGPANGVAPPTSIVRCSLLGAVRVRELRMASESLFTHAVVAARPGVGGARFCALPPGPDTPRRFRCQPDLALAEQADEPARAAAQRRLAPQFVSVRYGDPGYAQLAPGSADELRSGAEDGGEVGVMHMLYQQQRAAGLRVALDEFLPAGFEAGIFFET